VSSFTVKYVAPYFIITDDANETAIRSTNPQPFPCTTNILAGELSLIEVSSNPSNIWHAALNPAATQLTVTYLGNAAEQNNSGTVTITYKDFTKEFGFSYVPSFDFELTTDPRIIVADLKLPQADEDYTCTYACEQDITVSTGTGGWSFVHTGNTIVVKYTGTKISLTGTMSILFNLNTIATFTFKYYPSPEFEITDPIDALIIDKEIHTYYYEGNISPDDVQLVFGNKGDWLVGIDGTNSDRISVQYNGSAPSTDANAYNKLISVSYNGQAVILPSAAAFTLSYRCPSFAINDGDDDNNNNNILILNGVNHDYTYETNLPTDINNPCPYAITQKSNWIFAIDNAKISARYTGDAGTASTSVTTTISYGDPSFMFVTNCTFTYEKPTFSF
jgi:hypothetical protein